MYNLYVYVCMHVSTLPPTPENDCVCAFVSDVSHGSFSFSELWNFTVGDDTHQIKPYIQ